MVSDMLLEQSQKRSNEHRNRILLDFPTWSPGNEVVRQFPAIAKFNRVDLWDASSNMTPARFRPHEQLVSHPTLEEEEAFNERLHNQWGPEFPNSPIQEFEGMDEMMTKMFHRVRQLSALATKMHTSKKVEEIYQKQYTNSMLLLERQINVSTWSMAINNIRQYGSPTRPHCPKAVITCVRTWHTTMFLYVYLVLRKTPPNSRIVEKIVARLKYSLVILTEEGLWVIFLKRLFGC
jgi:hypothetical protein